MFMLRTLPLSPLTLSFSISISSSIYPAMDTTTEKMLLHANPVEIHFQQVNEIDSRFLGFCDYIDERLGK